MASVDRFEIESELGRGATAVVHRGRDRLSGRPVAIKVFRPSDAAGCDGGTRLEREARLLSRVRHPGIVAVLAAGRRGKDAWLVTEYVPGESLRERLRRRERLDPAEALSLVAQAARALAAAHRAGVIHRDVKPANLLVTDDGALKVTDFGVAAESVARSPARAEESAVFRGTPAYVAPEQWLGQPLDGRSDLYSLGVVLYRCLTGRRPHEGASVRAVMHASLNAPITPPSVLAPGLPPELDTLCLTALAREPARRFADGDEFAAALERVAVPARLGAAPGAEAVRSDKAPPREGRSAWRAAPWQAAAVLGLAVLALAFAVAPGVPEGGEAGPHAARESDVAISWPAYETPEAPAGSPPAVAETPSPGAGELRATDADALPDPALLARYGRSGAAKVSKRRAPAPTRRAQREVRSEKVVPARPAPREVALVDNEPQPEAVRPQEVAPAPEPESATPPAVETPAPGRGVVGIRHGLDEGLIEVRLDGRRVGLVRLRPEERASQGEVARVTFPVTPGEHRVEVRVLSASHGADAATSWRTRWDAGEFHARELRLVRSGKIYALETE